MPPDGPSPAIAQWLAAKAEYPDALIFFRMGDFYELFFEDAGKAAAALDIQLTERGTHAGRPIAMCGVPVHAAEMYLARLIRQNYRVAIAEQIENPRARTGKGPLKRAVVRLVTPGTLTEEALLDPARPNLLLALVASGPAVGAAWLDISAGRFETDCLSSTELPTLLGRLDPAEIVCAPELDLGQYQPRRAPFAPHPHAADDVREWNAIDPPRTPEASASALALAYIRHTQGGAMPALPAPRSVGLAGPLQIDPATRASLEIARARDGGAGNCVFTCVRRTVTAAGTRLLLERLSAPVTDLAVITARQDSWDWLVANAGVLEAIRAALRRAPDLARALGRLSLHRGTPRDLLAICHGLSAARAVVAAFGANPPPPLLQLACSRLDTLDALDLPPTAALTDPAPARLDDGGAIATGYDEELDRWRALRDDSRSALARLQLDLAQHHGVASLKIRHHQQLGYVIEVPAAAVERLRALPGLQLRQSTANGARFTDPELASLDRRIAEAAEAATARECVVFASLVAHVLAAGSSLAAASAALAEIDVAQSCAKVAEAGRWCRPTMDDSTAFCITAGRHPVVEAALTGQARFIANDCDLSPGRRLLLLTGPNMAGKSTYLRQNALIVLLAQAGLPVPAAAARIGVVDRLFCRVGASDDLARGRSTFMVEMTEAAAILHGATPRSLVIIDEIGRGTATLDGLAIAWALLEALHDAARARTIFATHFHELARLRHELPQLCPQMMRVKEWKGDVVFLHEVAEGAGGRSWGVQVAKLAGVPAPVVRRAASVLAALESRGAGLTQDVELPLFADPQTRAQQSQASPSSIAAGLTDHWVDLMNAIEPDRLTPKQALETLYELKTLFETTVTKQAD